MIILMIEIFVEW